MSGPKRRAGHARSPAVHRRRLARRRSAAPRRRSARPRARRSPRWPSAARPTSTTPSAPRPAPGPRGRPPRRSTARPGASRSSPGSARRRDELARALTLDQGKPLVAEAFDEVDELAEYFRMAAEDAKRRAGGAARVGLGRAPDPGRPGAARRDRRGEPVELAVHDGRRALRARAGGRATPWSGCPPRPPPRAARCWPRSSRRQRRAVPGRGVQLRSRARARSSVTPWPATRAWPAWASWARWRPAASVAVRAAGKAQLLELGGNGPMVILEDADLELAAERGAGGRVPVRRARAAPRASGSWCTPRCGPSSPSGWWRRPRRAVRLGDPFDPATTMGPLNNEADRGQVRPAHRRRRGRRRPDLLRRAPRRRVPDRAVRRADRARRRHPGHGDRARGDVRAGGAGGRGAARPTRRWS